MLFKNKVMRRTVIPVSKRYKERNRGNNIKEIFVNFNLYRILLWCLPKDETVGAYSAHETLQKVAYIFVQETSSEQNTWHS
jgi:hypothetical protein